ncbi:MAG: hypothetical protein IPL40_02380 [Proteobacteria bacterium]|nr:hypothetical protein [Pseudomonadota bacterium]
MTSEKLQRWKETEQGPSKLAAAVADVSLALPLRTEAALALVEIQEVQRLVDALRATEAGPRAALTTPLAETLLKKLDGARARVARPTALEAKDALFSLRASLTALTRTRVDTKLLAWLLDDWAGRAGGEHSGPKIVRAIGADAGPALARGLRRADAGAALVIAELLRDLGGEADRAAAAAVVIERLREPKGIAREPAYRALALLGCPLSRTFLLAAARAGAEDGRVLALLALAKDPQLSSAPALAALAGNARVPAAVREAAFTALEPIESPVVADLLAAIIARDAAEKVRYRSVEALVACCKVAGVARLLGALPAGYSYRRLDVSDFIERDVRALGAAVVPVLRGALSSPSWIARVIAVRLLGELGGRGDVLALRPLLTDETTLRGWDGGSARARRATVAAEAEIAIQRLSRSR